jgi:hypothetical protein
MITIEKIEQLNNKLNKDLQEYEEDWLEQGAKKILHNVYDIYHAYNFYYHFEYFIENFEDDYDFYWFSEEVIDKIINYEDNFLYYWVDHKYDYRHSERYNLENIEDFANALEIVIENMGE